jgi:hypothetical protein
MHGVQERHESACFRCSPPAPHLLGLHRAQVELTVTGLADKKSVLAALTRLDTYRVRLRQVLRPPLRALPPSRCASSRVPSI